MPKDTGHRVRRRLLRGGTAGFDILDDRDVGALLKSKMRNALSKISEYQEALDDLRRTCPAPRYDLSDDAIDGFWAAEKEYLRRSTCRKEKKVLARLKQEAEYVKALERLCDLQ